MEGNSIFSITVERHCSIISFARQKAVVKPGGFFLTADAPWLIIIIERVDREGW